MATEGPIDKLNIEVGVTPDLSGLDRAKAEAEAKGAELGKAIGDGIAKGSDPGDAMFGPGGGSGKKLRDSLDAAAEGQTKGQRDGGPSSLGVKMPWEDQFGRADDGDPKKGGAGQSVQNALGIVGLLTAQFDRFEKVGETIGNAMFDGAKQQMELTQAIKLLQQSLARSIELQQQAFESRTSGNLQVSDAMEKRKQDFEKQQAELQERLATFGAQDLLEGAAKYTIGFGQTSTSRDQARAQLAEVEDTLNSLRAQSTGVSGRERSRSTFGGALANATGIDPRSVGMGGTMSPAESEYVRDFYTANPNVAAEQLRWSRASYQEQQNMTREMLRTGRYVPR